MTSGVKQGNLPKSPSAPVCTTCLLCNQICKEDDNDHRQPYPFLYGQKKVGNNPTESLESQLSVFFLLKKILGLPQAFLESLLTHCGNPGAWKIRLCRRCTRLFKEVEFLWEKVKRLQHEYRKIAEEMHDVITTSISEEEVKEVEEYEEGNMKKRLQAGHVTDGVRLTYFTHLKENNHQTPQSLSIFDATPVQSQTIESQKHTLRWTEKGVPYSSFSDFEENLREMKDTLVSMKSVTDKLDAKLCVISDTPAPASLDVAHPTRITKSSSAEKATDDEMEIEILEPSSETTSSNRRVHAISSVMDNDTNPEPSIRIVHTSSLMEPEEVHDDQEDDGSNDAVPHIIGILKREPTATYEDLEDPLALDDDDNDPDYNPNSPVASSVKSKLKILLNGKQTQALKRPEEIPSQFRTLTICPVRRGPNFECSKCDAKFDTRVGCQSHILRDHYDDVPFHCHICSAKFTLINPLIEHVRIAHGGIRTPYDNDFDPTTDYVNFEYSKTLSTEEADNDPLQRQQIQTQVACPICGQYFTIKRSMHRHAKTAHGVVISNSQSVQKKPTVKRSGLGDPKYTCPVCLEKNVTFRSPSAELMDAHMIKNHNSRFTLPYLIRMKLPAKPPPPRKTTMKCPDCHKILPSAQAMADHLKNPENKCQDCPKHFLFEMDLTRHIELEHERRNMQCPYCPKSFTAQTIYEKHIENHQIHDSHECEVCQERFTGYGNLARHMEIHSDFLQQSQPDQDPLAYDI